MNKQYPPAPSDSWPSPKIVGLIRKMVYSKPDAISAESFPDLMREIISYIDPIGAKTIRAKNFKTIFDVNNDDFLFDRSMLILDVILGASKDASDHEVENSKQVLHDLVKAGDALTLSMLSKIMDLQRDEVSNISLALAIKRNFERSKKILPTKHDLKMQMVKSGECTLSLDDNKGWARLWTDSGLDYLPKKSPHRGKTKHGK